MKSILLGKAYAGETHNLLKNASVESISMFICWNIISVSHSLALGLFRCFSFPSDISNVNNNFEPTKNQQSTNSLYPYRIIAITCCYNSVYFVYVSTDFHDFTPQTLSRLIHNFKRSINTNSVFIIKYMLNDNVIYTRIT